MGDAGSNEGREHREGPGGEADLAVEADLVPVDEVEELVCCQALRLPGDNPQKRRGFFEVALEPLGRGP